MSAIHIKSPALTLKAGPRALARIRQNGLSPADVGILPGAAGGPKGIGIQGLDLALFGDWLPRAPVSYTHLDVYKRQDPCRKERTMLFSRLSIQWKITLLAGLCLLAIVTLLVSASQYQACLLYTSRCV